MARPNLGKTRINLTIRRDVLEAARKYIPNLSDFVEGKLLEFLFYVKDPIAMKYKGAVVGSPGFEPGTFASSRRRHNR